MISKGQTTYITDLCSSCDQIPSRRNLESPLPWTDSVRGLTACLCVPLYLGRTVLQSEDVTKKSLQFKVNKKQKKRQEGTRKDKPQVPTSLSFTSPP